MPPAERGNPSNRRAAEGMSPPPPVSNWSLTGLRPQHSGPAYVANAGCARVAPSSRFTRGTAMKIAATICRILLGLIFVVFGANGLHPFLPTPPPMSGPAGRFVHGHFCFPLRDRSVSVSAHRRTALAHEPLRSAGSRHPRASARQHPLLPRLHAAPRPANGHGRGPRLVLPFLCLPQILCRIVRTKTGNLISKFVKFTRRR